MIDRENAVARLSPSKKHAFFSVSKTLVLGVVSLVLAKFVSAYFILLFLLLIGVAGYRFLHIVFTQYVITSETISTTTGIVAKRVDITELYRVRDYVVRQSVVQRLFGLMTVTLITSDSTHPKLNLTGIPKSDITEIIRESPNAQQDHRNVAKEGKNAVKSCTPPDKPFGCPAV